MLEKDKIDPGFLNGSSSDSSSHFHLREHFNNIITASIPINSGRKMGKMLVILGKS